MSEIKKIIAVQFINDKEFIKQEQFFDENGNNILERIYDDDGNFESQIATKYDEKNRIVEQQNFLSEEELGEKVNYIRDEEGKISKEIIEYPDGSQSIKTYNRDGNVLIINIEDDEGEFEGTEQYTLNSNNDILEKTVFDEDNKLSEKFKNEFNDKNKVVKSIEYENETISFIADYEYDSNDNNTKIIKKNHKNEIVDSIVREFDENNRIILEKFGRHYIVKTSYNDDQHSKVEERFDLNGNIQFSIESFYDETGKILEERTPFSVTKYTYEY